MYRNGGGSDEENCFMDDGYRSGRRRFRLLRLCEDANVTPYPGMNVRREFVDRWRKPGDEEHTTIPAILGGQAYKDMSNPWWRTYGSDTPWVWDNKWTMYDNSDLRVASGNYLKLSSISLRYVVPEKLCHKLYMKSAYVSLSGTNLFTICSKELKGQDPSQSGSSELVNISVRPTYSLTLNVTF